MARAGNGDLYVGGSVYRSADNSEDWCVARYTSAGKRKWVRTLPISGENYVYAMSADATGHVALCGYCTTATGGQDGQVAVWDQRGRLLWQKRMDGGSHESDQALSCAYAPDGTLVVAGHVLNTDTYDDGFVTKYSAAGRVRWSHLIDGPSHGPDSITAAVVDDLGYVYASGWDYASGSRAEDALLIRYTAKGKAVWTRHWGSDAQKNDRFMTLSIRGGYVACAGWTDNDRDAVGWQASGLVALYSVKGGALKWAAPLQNPNSAAWPLLWTFCGVDAKGRVAVAGRCTTTGKPEETSWLTSVYSATGVHGILTQSSGTNTWSNEPMVLTSTPGGTVYVGGKIVQLGLGACPLVEAFSASGAQKWTSRAPSVDADRGIVRGIVATPTGVYVSGGLVGKLTLQRYAR
jgi:hypothetical protein